MTKNKKFVTWRITSDTKNTVTILNIKLSNAHIEMAGDFYVMTSSYYNKYINIYPSR